jgi:hypothetical protein
MEIQERSGRRKVAEVMDLLVEALPANAKICRREARLGNLFEVSAERRRS